MTKEIEIEINVRVRDTEKGMIHHVSRGKVGAPLGAGSRTYAVHAGALPPVKRDAIAKKLAELAQALLEDQLP